MPSVSLAQIPFPWGSRDPALLGALSALPAVALPIPPGMVGSCAELSGLKPPSLPLHIATRHICSDLAPGPSDLTKPPTLVGSLRPEVFQTQSFVLCPGGGTSVVTSWSVSLGQFLGAQPWPLLQA